MVTAILMLSTSSTSVLNFDLTTSRTVVPGIKYDGPAGGEDGLDKIASSNYSHQRGPIKPELVLSGKQCAI